jgi:hypothetical protein
MTNVYLWHVESVFCGNPVFGVLLGIQSQEPKDLGLVGLAYAPDEEIDGHWFVRVTDSRNPTKFDSRHDEIIAVTSHKERIPTKLYDFAKKYAARHAELNGCEFVDETFSGQSRSYRL